MPPTLVTNAQYFATNLTALPAGGVAGGQVRAGLEGGIADDRAAWEYVS
jgi:hypothetical protein